MSIRAAAGVLIVVLAAVCGMPCAAHAQAGSPAAIGVDHERPPPLESDDDDERPSYAWQTALADMLSLGLLVGGVFTWTAGWSHEHTQPALLVLGLAGYVAATPAIHYFGHRNDWALYSLVLRLVAPALVVGSFVMVSRAFDETKDPLPGSVQVASAIGLLVGIVMLVSIPIVDAVLATEKKKGRSRAALAPFITPRADGGGLMFTTRL